MPPLQTTISLQRMKKSTSCSNTQTRIQTDQFPKKNFWKPNRPSPVKKAAQARVAQKVVTEAKDAGRVHAVSSGAVDRTDGAETAGQVIVMKAEGQANAVTDAAEGLMVVAGTGVLETVTKVVGRGNATVVDAARVVQAVTAVRANADSTDAAPETVADPAGLVKMPAPMAACHRCPDSSKDLIRITTTGFPPTNWPKLANF
jgi:hypothetical protein